MGRFSKTVAQESNFTWPRTERRRLEEQSLTQRGPVIAFARSMENSACSLVSGTGL